MTGGGLLARSLQEVEDSTAGRAVFLHVHLRRRAAANGQLGAEVAFDIVVVRCTHGADGLSTQPLQTAIPELWRKSTVRIMPLSTDEAVPLQPGVEILPRGQEVVAVTPSGTSRLASSSRSTRSPPGLVPET